MVPSNKVGGAAIAGAVTIILVWAVKQFGNTVIPTEVAQAITVLISFGTGYFVADK